MRRILATAALVIAWLCANGALWDAAQVVAWGRMFAGYSETMSLTDALRETFDPAKPCALCLSIAKAKENAAEKQAPAAPSADAAKFVLAMDTPDAPVFANDPGTWTERPPARFPDRTDPVPLPPPRA